MLFGHWEQIVADLADIHVDLADSVVLEHRSWPWLRDRIVGLLDKPGGSRLLTALSDELKREAV